MYHQSVVRLHLLRFLSFQHCHTEDQASSMGTFEGQIPCKLSQASVCQESLLGGPITQERHTPQCNGVPGIKGQGSNRQKPQRQKLSLTLLTCHCVALAN